MKRNSIPLTVIGGFLGAGKTTLLNHLLNDAQGVRFAILVNDFGDLAIDEKLISKHDGETIALANGCICCNIGDDLIETIMDLTEVDDPPQHLVIEASGVANPGTISELGSLCPGLSRDLTIIVIDAEQVITQWSDERLKETVDRQISAGNLMVLNKVEALNEVELSNLDSWLDSKAAKIPRIKTNRGRVPIEVFTDLSLNTDPCNSGHNSTANSERSDSRIPLTGNHQNLFQTATLTVSSTITFREIEKKATELPSSVLRAKGFVCIAGVNYLLQKVGPRLSIVQMKDTDAVPSSMTNRIVVIAVDSLPSGNWFEHHGSKG